MKSRFTVAEEFNHPLIKTFVTIRKTEDIGMLLKVDILRVSTRNT